MARCLISFGANIGQPAETIRHAAQQLQSHLAGSMTGFQLSRLFRTPAVGGPSGQPPFVNAVAALELDQRSAWDVWHIVRKIEESLGRVRQERWEARRIDLDVLLFDQQRIWTQHFKLPHPRMVMRRFILEPALDVAAQWQEPVSGMTVRQLTQSLRQGTASIALVTNDLTRAQKLLEKAAAKSQAAWLTPTIVGCRELFDQASAVRAEVETPTTRWLGLVSTTALQKFSTRECASSMNSIANPCAMLTPAPRIVFALADSTARVGAAWEDLHRPLARWLGLCSTECSQDITWPLAGPRYLLSTDDPNWAVHEIVAALEAMDCPVEPIDS